MSMKTKGCALGLALGSALRAFIYLFNVILKGIAWVLVFFGLWIPFFYALGGVILYLIFHFNPFDGSQNSVLYLVGFGLCCVGSVIITIRKLILKPLKSVAEGYKKPLWTRKDEVNGNEEKEEEAPNKTKKRRERVTKPEETEAEKPLLSENPSNKDSLTQEESALPRAYREEPKVYYSTREPNTLIHEYNDRFEVYRVVGEHKFLDKVEYKNYGL